MTHLDILKKQVDLLREMIQGLRAYDKVQDEQIRGLDIRVAELERKCL